MSRSSIFKPSYIRRITNSVSTDRLSASDLSGTIMHEEDTFKYDMPGTGLKSTQQLNIDWSDFSRHTFFNSAEAKTNVAFDNIINRFPFDGTREDLERYYQTLTGFEKYVYEEFPKNIGYLNFDSSLGSYIEVKDRSGALIPSLADDPDAKSILNHGTGSISFEFNIFIPSGSIPAGSQIIAQKKDPTSSTGDGITLSLDSTIPIDPSVDFTMTVISGSNTLQATMALDKGRFNHVCGVLNNITSDQKITLYKDCKKEATSDSIEIGKMSEGYIYSPFYIGAGTAHGPISPLQTLTGSIDEFRVWHSARTIDEIIENKDKNVFSDNSENLKLYFKFNEPYGDYHSNNVVLDSSGNSMHSLISNFDPELRNNNLIDTSGDIIPPPLVLENIKNSPVLFSSFPDVTSLNAGLLNIAVGYDSNNPNLITKLVPKHYLLEGQFFEGLETEEGEIGSGYSSDGNFSVPGAGQLGSSQVLASLLFTWAKFFDEIKMFLDQVTDILHLDYTDKNVISDQMLPFLAEQYGFTLPMPFMNASVEQLFEGVNINTEPSISDVTLQSLQNELWRRILLNINEITRSKGTIHSTKVLMRSMGIDPDKYFRFREYGGSRTKDLSDSRKVITQKSTMFDMSGSSIDNPGSFGIHGYPTSEPFVTSSFLSGSRIEPGYPEPLGSFILKPTSLFDSGDYGYHGISNEPSDGLYTSGSWTYESIYKFKKGSEGSLQDQSLVRLLTTGSLEVSPAVIANVISRPSENSLDLLIRPGNLNTDEILQIKLNDVSIQDGDKWHISFGRIRNDDKLILHENSYASSSYFISAGKINAKGNIEKFEYKNEFFKETNDPTRDTKLSKINPDTNASGSFIAIGWQDIDTSTTPSWGLGPTATSDNLATRFTGEFSNLRFWSKALSINEIKEHIRDYLSLGVVDPSKNFNFVSITSGSFEKLRMNIEAKQGDDTTTEFGEFRLFDYSQNDNHLIVSGLENEKKVLKPYDFTRNFIDPRFDEHSVENKVRVRGFQDFKNIDNFHTSVAPVYEILASEKTQDDTRFSIDMSSMQALNEDIIRVFSTLDSLDNVLGSPELLFATEYPDLKVLRDVYFNRLTDKVNITSFFEFFKWFDSSIGEIIKDLIPKKTKFLGMNFVIESHMLERAKMKYSYEDVYLGDNNRHGLKGTITLQQYIANLRRY